MFGCGSKGHDNCTLGQQLSLRSALLGQRWVRLAQHRLEVSTYAVADKADCAASRFRRNASKKADREVVPAGRRPAHTDSLRFRAEAGGHSMLCPYGFVGFLKRWGQER